MSGTGGPTSLAPNRVSVADQVTGAFPDGETADRLDRCPRKLDLRMFDFATGQVAPARCRANSCPYCCRLNASMIAGAITLAEPERAVRLSLVGTEWQQIRNRLKMLAYRIRQAGFEVSWAYHVEPNPKGTGNHAHAWQRGDYLPQAQLQELCEREGLGIPYIERVKTPEAAGRYGLKLAGLDYGLKMADAEESAEVYRRLNGGRLVHASRDFWRDENGEQVGQREAMKAWARKTSDGSEHDWRLVRVGDIPRLAEGPAR